MFGSRKKPNINDLDSHNNNRNKARRVIKREDQLRSSVQHQPKTKKNWVRNPKKQHRMIETKSSENQSRKRSEKKELKNISL